MGVMRGKRLWLILIPVIVGLIATSGGAAYLLLKQEPYGIPKPIQADINYIVFMNDSELMPIDKNSYKFDRENKLFSYLASYQGNNLVFSMQPSPAEFAEVPDAYGRYIEKLNKILTFDSPLGQVSVTVPQDSGQVGVFNTQGTLMFVKVQTALSEDQWRQLANTLVARRI